MINSKHKLLKYSEKLRILELMLGGAEGDKKRTMGHEEEDDGPKHRDKRQTLGEEEDDEEEEDGEEWDEEDDEEEEEGDIAFCVMKGFKQHTGECWHDTIQQIFCFSNLIRHEIQPQIFFKNFAADVRSITDEKYVILPPCFREDPAIKEKFIGALIQYLQNMQIRFCNLIGREGEIVKQSLQEKQCIKILDATHPAPSGPRLDLQTRIKPLERQISTAMGTSCAVTGSQFGHMYMPEEMTYTTGGQYFSVFLLLIVLSFVFFDASRCIIPYGWDISKKNRSLGTLKMLMDMDYEDLPGPNMITEEAPSDSGQLVGIQMYVYKKNNEDEQPGHSVGFYDCDYDKTYYNDNDNKVSYFDWKCFIFLFTYLREKVIGLNIDICIIFTTNDLPFFRISFEEEGETEKTEVFEFVTRQTKKDDHENMDPYRQSYGKLHLLGEMGGLTARQKIDRIIEILEMERRDVSGIDDKTIFYATSMHLLRIYDSVKIMSQLYEPWLFADLGNGYFEKIDWYIEKLTLAKVKMLILQYGNIYCDPENQYKFVRLIQSIFTEYTPAENVELINLMQVLVRHGNFNAFDALLRLLNTDAGRKHIFDEFNMDLFKLQKYYYFFEHLFRYGTYSPLTKHFRDGTSLLCNFLQKMIEHNHVDFFNFLTDKEKEKDATFKFDVPCKLLHMICQMPTSNSQIFVDILLNKGADPNLLDENGNAPLHILCKYTPGNSKDLVQLLLDKGAKPNIKDKDNLTPLQILCHRKSAIPKDLVHILLENSADPNIPDAENNSVLHVLYRKSRKNLKEMLPLLLAKGINLNSKNKGGNTLLHFLCQSAMPDLVNMILDNGANSNSQNNNGLTPLHVLCALRTHDVQNIVAKLLDKGADPNLRAIDGNVPLIQAFIKSNVHMLPVVRLLLERGADPNMQTNAGVSIAQVAAKFVTDEPHYLDMFKLLINGDNPIVLNLDALRSSVESTSISNYIAANPNKSKIESKIRELLIAENKKRKAKTA